MQTVMQILFVLNNHLFDSNKKCVQYPLFEWYSYGYDYHQRCLRNVGENIVQGVLYGMCVCG